MTYPYESATPDGTTHWEGCERVHHDCALKMLDRLKAECDEALLSATFREDKHAEELGEKLMAALAQVAALREALEAWKWAEQSKGAPAGDSQRSRDFSADAIRRANVELHQKAVALREAALADTAAAAQAHDERIRAEEREAAWRRVDKAVGKFYNEPLGNLMDDIAAAIRGRNP